MTKVLLQQGPLLDPWSKDVEVDVDLTEFVWADLYYGLTDAPREDGWEGEAAVMHKGKTYWLSCDDIRAELGRRAALMEERRQRQLKNAHTRELLAWLNRARRFGGFYSPCDSKSDYGWCYDEIKAELATREHIPNKKEAKAVRQEAARQARRGKRG